MTGRGGPEPSAEGWNLVCFSGVDWDYNRQRPQWVVESLADRGARVLYVDNLGVRLPRPSDVHRIGLRLGHWFRTSAKRGTPVRSGIRRDAPLIPTIDRPGAVRWAAHRLLAGRIRRRVGPGRPLLVWTYSPAPAIAYVASVIRPDALVYDWADDASEHVLFSSAASRRRIRGWEDAMVRRADVVFVSSEELLRRRAPSNPRTYLVPHGGPLAQEDADPDPEVARLPGPRIGFVGTLSDWIDLDLLEKLAASHPEWSFVLVGPQRTRTNVIRGLANVTVLSPRPHADIPGILGAFDVALIPYRSAPAMAAASPVKLQEYLAHGLPVVSTDLPEVRRFAPPVEIATDAAGFASAIERALAAGRRAPRSGITWDQRVDEMVALVTEAMRTGAR